MGKNRRELWKLLEAKISPGLARQYFQRLNWHSIKEACIQCASKTSSMTAISQAQGALVSAVRKTEGRGGERRTNTAPLTRGTAICLVTIQEGNTEKNDGGPSRTTATS